MATIPLFIWTIILFILFSACWTGEIWLEPIKTFLRNNTAELLCYHKFEKGGIFKGYFRFYLNGQMLQGVGGGPSGANASEHFAYYILNAHHPGIYTCEVDNKNVKAEVFDPPELLTPVVSTIGDNVTFSCPKGPEGSTVSLDILGLHEKDTTLTDGIKGAILNIGSTKDAITKILCLYKFPSDNFSVSTTVPLIVVQNNVTDARSETNFTSVTCRTLSNMVDMTIVLTAYGKSPVYSRFNSTSVSEDFHSNTTNYTCSVLYRGREIWSKEFTIQGKHSNSGNGNGKHQEAENIDGLPKLALILIIVGSVGILIIVTAVVIYVIYRQYRTKGANSVNRDHRGNPEDTERFAGASKKEGENHHGKRKAKTKADTVEETAEDTTVVDQLLLTEM